MNLALQADLFGVAPEMPGPDGFRYAPDAILPAEELALVEQFRTLPFKEFEFQGFSLA